MAEKETETRKRIHGIFRGELAEDFIPTDEQLEKAVIGVIPPSYGMGTFLEIKRGRNPNPKTPS